MMTDRIQHQMRVCNRWAGFMLVPVLIFGGIAAYIIAGLSSWAVLSLQSADRIAAREQAIEIAEAGADYYRWHLAHSPLDFQDGTATSGPYVHEFFDKDGNRIGEFELSITPPPIGSTKVTITSIGRVDYDPDAERSITMEVAKPSIASYATVANAEMRFGEGTEVYGPIHSNGGIRFDGFAHNLVTSAVATYDDSDHSGANEFGVHTHIFPTDPNPPTAVPSRTDVFLVGRDFPVPAVDFVGITADLSQMKTDAQADGFYRAGSGALGYHVVLKTDDTFDLYSVTSYTSPPSNCTNSNNQTGWGTWSISNQTLLGNYAFPNNGIIFLEDHVFVNGTVNSARVTVIAALFPDNVATRKNIIINNDLLYTNHDGQDVVGLIAQDNVHIGLVSEDDLRIDAALIAQNGRVGRYYYRPPSGWQNRCSPYHERDIITLWGMIGTNQRYGFAYVDGNGYQIRNINYDAELLYAPPPSFPLTSDQYEILSWEENE